MEVGQKRSVRYRKQSGLLAFEIKISFFCNQKKAKVQRQARTVPALVKGNVLERIRLL